jgi:hypothetical protein
MQSVSKIAARAQRNIHIVDGQVTDTERAV